MTKLWDSYGGEEEGEEEGLKTVREDRGLWVPDGDGELILGGCERGPIRGEGSRVIMSDAEKIQGKTLTKITDTSWEEEGCLMPREGELRSKEREKIRRK